MKVESYFERINAYSAANPDISPEEIGVLLHIDKIYDIDKSEYMQFRRMYPHLDPEIISKETEGIMFLKIAESDEPASVIKHRLNSYINMKYHYLGNYRSYAENMKLFKEHCRIVSELIEEILEAAKMPKMVRDILKEKEIVRKTTDIYDMLKLYRSDSSERTRFEILRNIGLIVLISRINRTFLYDDTEIANKEVKNVFHKGLRLKRHEKRNYYYFIDEDNRVIYNNSSKNAKALYELANLKRKRLAMKEYPMQVFEYYPLSTKFGSSIIHIESRNKLKRNGAPYYTSIVEKMLRKKLEFPNQVHDVIGVKIVVRSEDEIPGIIRNLETFLGGSSTRKMEKNSLNKFGKKKVGKYSSEEYNVWKAVYDITLPHPSISKLHKLVSLLKGNGEAKEELLEKIRYFKDRPQDVVVEVQLQDIESYLMNLAEGHPACHTFLKMNQIRENSFYKFFPKEIYEKELKALRHRILKEENFTKAT